MWLWCKVYTTSIHVYAHTNAHTQTHIYTQTYTYFILSLLISFEIHHLLFTEEIVSKSQYTKNNLQNIKFIQIFYYVLPYKTNDEYKLMMGKI